MENQDRKKFQFIWKIENYGYSWLGIGEFITSPEFCTFFKEAGSWRLELYPRGTASRPNAIAMYLRRLVTDHGRETILIDYGFSFIRSDGARACVVKESGCLFEKGKLSGVSNLITRKELFGKKRSILLPNETLTVVCDISSEINSEHTHCQIHAKSSIVTIRSLFLWDAGLFNYATSTAPGSFSTFNLPVATISLNIEDDFVCFRLSYKESQAEVFGCKIHVLNSSNSTVKLLANRYMYTYEPQSLSFPLISRSELLQNGNYLSGQRLILQCEFTFSARSYFAQYVGQTFDKIFPIDVFEEKKDLTAEHFFCSLRDDIPSSLKDDLRKLYLDRTLSDCTLLVKGEYFHIHEAILCARSSVFRSILTRNAGVNNNRLLVIPHLEVDTVRRMLLFMYTDSAEGLDWNAAFKLYFAADTYRIMKLKWICSHFLKTNMNVANVADILTLAASPVNESLKTVVLDFISNHVVFVNAKEWGDFEAKNQSLASETARNMAKRIKHRQ